MTLIKENLYYEQKKSMENELTSKEGFNRHFMSSLLILLAEEWHDRTGMIQAARERIHIILNLFMIGCVTVLNSVDGNSLTTHTHTHTLSRSILEY